MRERTAYRLRITSRGFTLLETILVVVVVAVFATVLLSALHQVSAPASRQQALRSASLVADETMREIRSKAFEDPQTPATFGPEEAARRDYDDVDDYDGWTRSPPETIEGIPLPRYDGYRVTVTVVNVTDADLNPSTPPPDGSTDFKRISVVVSSPPIVATEIAAKKGSTIVTSPEVIVSNVSVVGRYD